MKNVASSEIEGDLVGGYMELTKVSPKKQRIHCKLNTKLNSAHNNFPKDAY